MMKKDLKDIRKKIINTSFTAQAGHIPSALSIVEIIYSIYKHIKTENDIFILSKGHGCLALYSVLENIGIISEEELLSFCSYDSKLGGHPHREKMKDFYCSAGSLGHGLPMAVGAALAKKIKKDPGYVYCLIGDGESNEGTVWESLLLAKNLNLNNLVCIIDDNNSQIRSLPVLSIEDKIQQFGWRVSTVDGHNVFSIVDSINKNNDLFCLVCKTKKGKGISEMEKDMFKWHHGPPNKEKYEQFIEEIENA